MNPSALSSLRRFATGPTAMFMVATTMATVCATLISVSLTSAVTEPGAGDIQDCEPFARADQEAGAIVREVEPAPMQTAKRTPRVRQAKATVDGELDRDIVRRIVRAHINEVRYCYNEALTSDPDTKGRVYVQFAIEPDGSVSESEVASTTIDDADVGECIANAVERWKFPRHDGDDRTVVTYPFVLSPG